MRARERQHDRGHRFHDTRGLQAPDDNEERGEKQQGAPFHFLEDFFGIRLQPQQGHAGTGECHVPW